jgi:DNA repair exonuclease SbcCD nuclease subunit
MASSVLLCGDLHLSDKAPSNCSDYYNDDLFVMLEEVVEIASLRSVSAVVFAGDIFHLKQANRTSHRTVQRMIDIIHSFVCPVYLVVGNHDVTHDRVDSIYETQPFGVLLKAGARLLDGWSSDFPLYGVSWQQDWQDASKAFTDWTIRANSHSLLVTHAPIYPPGRELPWENILASTIATWMNNTGYCYYGHVHPCHGSFEVDDVVFCNQGALSRGSLHEEDLTRKPAVTIWYSDRDGVDAFERVAIASAPPPERVFRLAECEAKTDYRDRLDLFLNAVRQSQVSVTSVESVLAQIRSMGLPGECVMLAEEVLIASISGELT